MSRVASPERGYTMGGLLADCQSATAADVEATWVDEAFARSAKLAAPVRNHGPFPVWHPQRGPDALTGQVISAAARDAGMRTRPVGETVRDLVSWWQSLPVERTSRLQAGVTPEFEAELIRRWAAQLA